jgi:NDP-sugar pyrophosphorylase family protein
LAVATTTLRPFVSDPEGRSGSLSTRAIILAGGRGRRLEPYTSVLPKPLMPLGDRAILEITVDRLVESGIVDVTLCVGHLAHLIEAVFNGRPRGASFRFVREDEPLGTAGPLRLVGDLNDTFLLMNGDLLTDLDFGALLEAHRAAGNAITIATHERRETIDYGVLHVDESESPLLLEYEEKPELKLTVSMGVYALEPSAVQHVPRGYFDFPDLVRALLAAGERVGTFPFTGFWLDIGRRDDYERAIEYWDAREAASRRS